MIYVPSAIVEGTRALLIGEAPGDSERRELRPFAGSAGYELDEQLRDAGMSRSEFSTANVLRHQPPGNDEECFATANKSRAARQGLTYDPDLRLFVAPWVPQHVKMLRAEIDRLQPNVLVPLGNLSLRILTGATGITNFRGSVLESKWMRADGKPFKVIPVIHPAAIFRQYSWRVSSIFDWCRVRAHMNDPALPDFGYDFTPEPSYSQASSFLAELEHRVLSSEEDEVWLSVDIETARGQITCIGVAVNERRALCFPLIDTRKPGCSYWSENEEVELIYRLCRVLDHPRCRTIGQNFNYDRTYIARLWGCWPPCSFDTSVAHHTLFPAAQKKLNFLSSWYCLNHRYWKDEGKGKEEKKEWGTKVDPVTLWNYNLKDCVITFEVANRLKELIAQRGMQAQVDFEMSLLEPIGRQTIKGVRIDLKAKHRMKKELQAEVVRMQFELNEIVGHELAPSKPKQIQALFYDDMQLPKQWKKDKYGKKVVTTDEDALHKIAAAHPIVKPITDRILNIRSSNVYLNGYLSCETPGSRIYTSYDVAGTSTLRFSSRKDPFQWGTNLQNRPKGTGKIAKAVRERSLTLQELAEQWGKGEDGWWKLFHSAELEQESGMISITGQYPRVTFHYQLWKPNVAEMFVPDEGMLIGDFDLERADIYAMAWEAEAVKLKQMLRERVDLHTENARTLESTRDQAKIAAHAFDYKATPKTVAANAGVTVHKAEQMQRRWFGEHPEILRWHRATERILKETGGVRNKFGFGITYFDRLDQMLPEALAWVPSSTVAIVINTGLLRIEAMPDVEFLMQTHDSLNVQIRIEDRERLDTVVREALLVTVPYDDPLVIPVSGSWSAVSLAECKE